MFAQYSLSSTIYTLKIVFCSLCPIGAATDTSPTDSTRRIKSAGPCISAIEAMDRASSNVNQSSLYANNTDGIMVPDGNATGIYSHGQQLCLGCYRMTQGECAIDPVPCQELINGIYWSCEGVTLPDGYYFNPPVSLRVFEIVSWSGEEN